MPYVRRIRRRRPAYRRRALARPMRKMAYRPRIRRPLTLSGFPEKKLVKMRYVESIQLSSAVSGATQTHFFSCNSCYDPNATGVGHQPYGFDQWSAIYDHYKVLGSKCTIRVTNTGAAQTGTIYGIKINDDTTLLTTNANSLMEEKNSRYGVVVAQNAPKVITSKWSLKRTNDKYNDDFSAPVNAGPLDQEYFCIYVASADQGALGGAPALGTICINVQIDYITLFTEMKDFATS